MQVGHQTTTVAAQIDACACVDRAYGLPAVWSFTAPLGWIVAATIILEGRPEHDPPLAMELAQPTKTGTCKKDATHDE